MVAGGGAYVWHEYLRDAGDRAIATAESAMVPPAPEAALVAPAQPATPPPGPPTPTITEPAPAPPPIEPAPPPQPAVQDPTPSVVAKAAPRVVATAKVRSPAPKVAPAIAKVAPPPVAAKVETPKQPTIEAPSGSTLSIETPAPAKITPAPPPDPKPVAVTPVAPTEPPAVTPKPAVIEIGSMDATPTITSLDVNGPLPSSVVRRGVERILPALRTCYRNAAKTGQKTPLVSLSVSFEIDENSSATNVSAARGAAFGPLQGCVRGSVSRLQTQQAPDVGTAQVVLVITFRPI